LIIEYGCSHDFMVAKVNAKMTEVVEGFKVVKLANSRNEALSYIEKNDVDLIILDIYLTDIPGIEILKSIRGKACPVDFVLITAAQDHETVENSIRFGVFDYIIKPFDVQRYKKSLLNYKKMRESISAYKNFNQEKLDEVTSYRAFGKSVRQLPKGIARHTLSKVEVALENFERLFTIDDVMQNLSFSRVTARRHLEFMFETGYLEKSFEYKMKDTIIDCNQKTLEMFCCTREEIIGVSVQTLSPPNQSDGENSTKKALEKIEAALGGVPQFFEWKYVRRDGSLFDAEVSLNLFDLQGKTYLQAIVRGITERIKTVMTLREIAEGRQAITGQGFFDAAVSFLKETLGARYAFIRAVTGSRHESVLTIAVSDRGRLVNNLIYTLAGTPCENVVGQKRCIYPSGVHCLFPKHHLLTEIQIESYAGISLYDSLYKPSGIIVILDDKPMENVGLVETMLDIISVRAASELERMAIDKTLKESEELYRTLAEHSFAGVYVVQDGKLNSSMRMPPHLRVILPAISSGKNQTSSFIPKTGMQ
jgi:PAS domain S-box-containing protein